MSERVGVSVISECASFSVTYARHALLLLTTWLLFSDLLLRCDSLPSKLGGTAKSLLKKESWARATLEPFSSASISSVGLCV